MTKTFSLSLGMWWLDPHPPYLHRGTWAHWALPTVSLCLLRSLPLPSSPPGPSHSQATADLLFVTFCPCCLVCQEFVLFVFLFFLLLSSIPLYEYTIVCLTIQLLVKICTVSNFLPILIDWCTSSCVDICCYFSWVNTEDWHGWVVAFYIRITTSAAGEF